MGKQRFTVSTSQDVYDDIVDRVDSTGKSKSEIVDETYRDARLATDGGNGTGSFYESIGQSLFAVGPVVALLSAMSPGIGMMIFGLGLMLFARSRHHLQNGATGYGDALSKTLGI